MGEFNLSARSFEKLAISNSWEEIWEAGPYFDRVSELLEDGKEYAVIVGWQIDSRLKLKRPWRPNQNSKNLIQFETLLEKVLRICNEKPRFQFYFLIWDHAYFYVLEREAWQGRIWENVHPRVHFVFDNRHPWGVAHHEKIVSIDGKVILCGGIDLCDERWDSRNHFYFDQRRSLHRQFENHGPYHDLAIQVTGPICDEIQSLVGKRWRMLSSIPFPEVRKPNAKQEVQSGHKVYLSRTYCQIDYCDQMPVLTRQIEFLFKDMIYSAENRIILEGQYYWSKILNDLLISKMVAMKGKRFEIILILSELQNIKSLTRYMTAYEAGLLRKLQMAADYYGVKLILGSPAVCSADKGISLPPKPIYIHSKVIVIDDQFLSIGSANLATRALRLDTEVQLTLKASSEYERCHIRRVAQSILSHWNVYSKSEKNGVYLKPFSPHIELKHLKNELEIAHKFHVRKIFDPTMPWAYSLKFGVRKLYKRNRDLLLLSLFWLWLLGGLFSGLIAGTWNEQSQWMPIYGIVLTSVWIVPIPYLFIVLVSIIHLGTTPAIVICVASFWVASILGYFITRTFPSLFSYFNQVQAPSRITYLLGLRNFPHYLKMLFDPSISVRSKMIYPGLSCIPLPWFLLGMIVIFPSILYSFSHIAGILVQAWVPV